MVVSQIKNFCQELGFTWKKVLFLTVLSAVSGLVLALVIPLQVS